MVLVMTDETGELILLPYERTNDIPRAQVWMSFSVRNTKYKIGQRQD